MCRSGNYRSAGGELRHAHDPGKLQRYPHYCGRQADHTEGRERQGREPFTVDNTTYLPVRAVAEALGKTVTWDEKTQTVYIGEVPSEEGTYLTPNEIRGGSQITDPKELPLYNSADRKTVLYLSDSIADRYAIYDLGGKYKTISFTVLLPFGGSPDETSFQFYVDGALKLTVPRSSISTPKDFELDVTGAKTLKIVKTPTYDEIANGFCVADMRAK